VQRIILPGTTLQLPRFVFGTASLLKAGTQARRVRVLDAAVAHGLTHFDTAPYYGFGLAERDLAPVLRRNSHVTVTTKVGIYSPGGECQPAAAVFLRKASGRLFPAFCRPIIDWSVARARRSLEASLGRLGRDCIDLYMLHEPELVFLLTDEWLCWLEEEVAAGRVRHFGVAMSTARLQPFLAAASPLAAVVQTNDNFRNQEAHMMLKYGRPLQITYGYISDALRSGGSVDAPAILAQALTRNSTAVVEMRLSSRLVAGIVLAVERHALKKLRADENALLDLLNRWRSEAGRSGHKITRIAAAYEAGRDGLWLRRSRTNGCCNLISIYTRKSVLLQAGIAYPAVWPELN
jgi:D-threo-aldose 1-dehydrogenase